jgi:hypothetical protein
MWTDGSCSSDGFMALQGSHGRDSPFRIGHSCRRRPPVVDLRCGASTRSKSLSMKRLSAHREHDAENVDAATNHDAGCYAPLSRGRLRPRRTAASRATQATMQGFAEHAVNFGQETLRPRGSIGVGDCHRSARRNDGSTACNLAAPSRLHWLQRRGGGEIVAFHRTHFDCLMTT